MNALLRMSTVLAFVAFGSLLGQTPKIIQTGTERTVEAQKVRVLETPGKIRFGVLGNAAAGPAPTRTAKRWLPRPAEAIQLGEPISAPRDRTR